MDSLQSLVSSKSSDSGLHIQLHPLVLLTISDHITRHAARQQQGPIIGALLGQQNGREITLEQVFECPVTIGENGEVLLPSSWFEERLKQCMYNQVFKPTITTNKSQYTDKDIQSKTFTKTPLSTLWDGGQLHPHPDLIPPTSLFTNRSSKTTTSRPSFSLSTHHRSNRGHTALSFH